MLKIKLLKSLTNNWSMVVFCREFPNQLFETMNCAFSESDTELQKYLWRAHDSTTASDSTILTVCLNPSIATKTTLVGKIPFSLLVMQSILIKSRLLAWRWTDENHKNRHSQMESGLESKAELLNGWNICKLVLQQTSGITSYSIMWCSVVIWCWQWKQKILSYQRHQTELEISPAQVYSANLV